MKILSRRKKEKKPSGSNFDCCEEALEAFAPRNSPQFTGGFQIPW